MSLFQLNATDKDFAQNSLIDYSIVPDAENRHLHFYIDQSNGSLYTAQKLDRETIAMYSILVKAKDRAPAGQTRLANLKTFSLDHFVICFPLPSEIAEKRCKVINY